MFRWWWWGWGGGGDLAHAFWRPIKSTDLCVTYLLLVVFSTPPVLLPLLLLFCFYFFISLFSFAAIQTSASIFEVH